MLELALLQGISDFLKNEICLLQVSTLIAFLFDSIDLGITREDHTTNLQQYLIHMMDYISYYSCHGFFNSIIIFMVKFVMPI